MTIDDSRRRRRRRHCNESRACGRCCADVLVSLDCCRCRVGLPDKAVDFYIAEWRITASDTARVCRNCFPFKRRSHITHKRVQRVLRHGKIGINFTDDLASPFRTHILSNHTSWRRVSCRDMLVTTGHNALNTRLMAATCVNVCDCLCPTLWGDVIAELGWIAKVAGLGLVCWR